MSTVQQAVTGGCFCGAVRYAFSPPEIATVNCHCSMCRKTSAAAFVTWLVVPTDQFEYTSGQPRQLQSSADGTRYFCADCGSPLVCINSGHPQWTDVTLGSLDDPEQFTPSKDVFDDTRLSWVQQLDAGDE